MCCLGKRVVHSSCGPSNAVRWLIQRSQTTGVFPTGSTHDHLQCTVWNLGEYPSFTLFMHCRLHGGELKPPEDASVHAVAEVTCSSTLYICSLLYLFRSINLSLHSCATNQQRKIISSNSLVSLSGRQL